MKINLRIAWGVLILAGGVAIAVSGSAYARAKSAATAEQARSAQAGAQASEAARLRPVAVAWATRRRPDSGLAARVAETVATCGLPAAAVANVTPQPETTETRAGETVVKRQRASITLTPVTLPQLGDFLDAWRSREPNWTVATVDVSPEPPQNNQPPTPGADLPLRVVISLDALYLDAPVPQATPNRPAGATR